MPSRCCTALIATDALRYHPAGRYARDMLVRYSIQSVSNALRHAEGYGWVRRHQPRRHVAALWTITTRGLGALEGSEAMS